MRTAREVGYPGLPAGCELWPFSVSLRYAFLSPADGSRLAARDNMLKFLGAYALAKLLGFGLLGAIVIYLLIR